MDKDRIGEIERRIFDLEQEKKDLLSELKEIRHHDLGSLPPLLGIPAARQPPVSPAEKVHLFLTLFRCREDVYPKLWVNAAKGKSGYSPLCGNEWKSGLCFKPQMKCSKCSNRAFLKLDTQAARMHLEGKISIGTYAIRKDDTCTFLAADFDKMSWSDDVIAYKNAARELGIEVAVERSRSGNGAHAWIFFRESIPCIAARKMGAYLLTETMERRPEIGLDSYDRFFPNQDTLPKGGLGNLIALPLQKAPRDRGNSVFLDDLLVPYPDQWAFLSSLPRMAPEVVEELAGKASESGRVTGLRLPMTDAYEDKPWDAPPSGKAGLGVNGPFPKDIELTLANQIFLPKENISPSLRNALIRVAAFQNPEFYQKQAMRMPVWNVPRIISCAENFPQHIALPRGCLEDTRDLLESLGINIRTEDKRFVGDEIEMSFTGNLYPEQREVDDQDQAESYHEAGCKYVLDRHDRVTGGAAPRNLPQRSSSTTLS